MDNDWSSDFSDMYRSEMAKALIKYNEQIMMRCEKLRNAKRTRAVNKTCICFVGKSRYCEVHKDA